MPKNKSGFSDIPISPLSGRFDLRSASGNVPFGDFRVILNASMNQLGKRCRRHGWRKLGFNSPQGFNNQDLHDQLVDFQLYYTDTYQTEYGGAIIGYNDPWFYPDSEISSYYYECEVDPLAAGPECVGICYASNVDRYYVNEMINTRLTVGIINPSTMTRVGEITVGSGSTGAVRLFALYHNGKVYVGRSDTGGKFVTVIDPTTDTVITDIPMTGGGSFMSPSDAVYCPTSDRIYVAAGQGVVVINPGTDTQDNYISLGSSSGAASVDYYAGEDRIFATINSGTSKPIYEIDPSTETLLTSFGTNSQYSCVRFHPDGYLYAINHLAQVRRWNVSLGVRSDQGAMNFNTPSGGSPRWLHVPHDDNGILVSTDINDEMYRINEVTHATSVSSGIFGYDEIFDYANPWARFAEHDAGGGEWQLFMSGLDGDVPFEGVKRITNY